MVKMACFDRCATKLGMAPCSPLGSAPALQPSASVLLGSSMYGHSGPQESLRSVVADE